MIYVFLADGFEEIEALTPVDYLRRCELEVKMVGVTGVVVKSSHGIRVMPDVLLSHMDLNAADMIILPGGMPGTLNLEQSQAVQDAVDFCARHDRWIGAICAAPSILGHKGLLDGKTATCYPGFEAQMGNAKLAEQPGVYVDGKIITATSVHFAEQFAFTLGECLLGSGRMDLLKTAVVYR